MNREGVEAVRADETAPIRFSNAIIDSLLFRSSRHNKRTTTTQLPHQRAAINAAPTDELIIGLV